MDIFGILATRSLASVSIFFLVLAKTISGSGEICGLGTANDYSPWIADDYGRLSFPLFNQDVYGVSSNVDLSQVCPETLTDRITSGYDEDKDSPCQFDILTSKSVCKGKIDVDYVRWLRLARVKTFVVDGYNQDSVQIMAPLLSTANNKISPTALFTCDGTYDAYKIAGEVYSMDISLGMKLSVQLAPNVNCDGYDLEGDAFYNELRVGWKVTGQILVVEMNDTLSLKVNVSSADTDSIWSLFGEGTLLSFENNTWSWDLKGLLDADLLFSRLAFSGQLTSAAGTGWTLAGSVHFKSILLTWNVFALITPIRSETVTIPKRLFADNHISHLFFKDSFFMGDFDKDALEDIRQLETITFLNSKLEEVPRLDLLFLNLTQLKAIYFEGTSMPNIVLGVLPSLTNLQLISFKGSGPLQLGTDSFQWLMGSNLTYVNLQDCNIKPAAASDSVLFHVRNTLKFLDLSYTSLTEEKYLMKMTRNLSLTHLSLAGLQLTKVPRTTLEQVSQSLQYLSLRGNTFRKVPDENMFSVILDFPEMKNLRELDLKRCGINFIEAGTFDMLPKLEKLYLSYNNIENVQEGWLTLMPGLSYIDLSHNGATETVEPISTFNILTNDGLGNLTGLEIVDLSYGKFETPESFVSSLSTDILGVSLCSINLRNLSFPSAHFDKMIVLDVSDNSAIQFGSWQTVSFLSSLTSLQYLHARNNKITNSFLTAVEQYVNYSQSQYFLENLSFIDLSGNNIKTLSPSSFRYFPSLEIVDLTSNSITTWSEPLLKLNPLIKSLKISDNKIERINDIMMADFYKLDLLEIGQNPFACECYAQKMVQQLNRSSENLICQPHYWFNAILGNKKQGVFIMDGLKRNKREAVPESTNAKNLFHVETLMQTNPKRTCKASIFASNSYGGRKKCVTIADWSISNYYCYSSADSGLLTFQALLNSSDLCLPLSAAALGQDPVDFTFVYVGMTVSILLGMIAGVVYWKWWDIRLLTRAVRNAAILSFMDKEDEEPLLPYQYSTFVSYSDKDRPWVLQQLLPHLEAWTDQKVCLHERDFQVGVSILENITNCMDRSKNVVLILSQSFMRSQWCQYEMLLAQHRLIESRRNHLILILLEPIPSYKKPKALRYLMWTKTYMEWPPSPDKEAEACFWERLFKALSLHADPALTPNPAV